MADDFYTYLRTQCPDLASAKRFAWRWANVMDQEIPGFGGHSMRAMAGHLSHVLEGTEPDGFLTNYMATKHGSEIYWAMCAPSEDAAVDAR